MTVIAYRDGVMASDTGCWIGDASHGWADKLARASDGTLYGVAGSAAQGEGFLEWVRAGSPGKSPKPDAVGERDSSFIVLIALPDGTIEVLTAYGRERFRGAPYFSIGAASSVAFGALHAGATAVGAIEAALAHGSNAHGSVRSISREAP